MIARVLRRIRCWAGGCRTRSDPVERPAVRQMLELTERLDHIVEAEHRRRNPFADTLAGRPRRAAGWRPNS